MQERWLWILGFPHYQISDHGKVMSHHGRVPRLLAERPDSKGYLRAQLSEGGVIVERFVHQLVLEAYVGERPPGTEGRHRNGVRRDNLWTNLLWSTHAENMRDQYEHGTRARGDTHGMVVLTRERVLAIRASTGRLADAAAEHGVSRSTICSIRLRKSWAHV